MCIYLYICIPICLSRRWRPGPTTARAWGAVSGATCIYIYIYIYVCIYVCMYRYLSI